MTVSIEIPSQDANDVPGTVVFLTMGAAGTVVFLTAGAAAAVVFLTTGAAGAVVFLTGGGMMRLVFSQGRQKKRKVVCDLLVAKGPGVECGNNLGKGLV